MNDATLGSIRQILTQRQEALSAGGNAGQINEAAFNRIGDALVGAVPPDKPSALLLAYSRANGAISGRMGSTDPGTQNEVRAKFLDRAETILNQMSTVPMTSALTSGTADRTALKDAEEAWQREHEKLDRIAGATLYAHGYQRPESRDLRKEQVKLTDSSNPKRWVNRSTKLQS